MKKYILLTLMTLFAVLFIGCNQEEPALKEEKCQHEESEWGIATQPTCTSAGLKYLQCDKCGEQTKIIPANGHTWINATCTKAKYCSSCDLQEGEAIGHNYTSSVKTEAKCTSVGVELYSCSGCGDSYESEISMLGHSNVLQDSGADVCSVCNTESYSTYSIKALTTLYQRLLSPKSATISYVYAGECTWEEHDCIAVVIHFTAQVVAGGLNDAEYVILFDLETGVMTFDLVGEMQKKVDYYERLEEGAYGATKLEYIKLQNVYLDKQIEALRIRQNKVLNLKLQDLNYINEISKKDSGEFD